jgi:phosphohistidine phosphatase
MKELLLLRHAKAVRGDPNLKDFDRPLEVRGEAQIPVVADIIKKENIAPDYILSSSSKRTRQTAEKIAKEINYSNSFAWSDKLYEANISNYTEHLYNVSDEFNRVMIVGHNPTHEEFVSRLAGEDISLSTGALAYFKIQIASWKEMGQLSRAKLVNVWRPKDIM